MNTAVAGLPAFTRWQFVRLLAGAPFFLMVGLVFVEAVLGATVTYLVIQAGRDIVNDAFVANDFLWILLAQAGSYLLHTVSWIFGERAGFRAFARYLVLFGRDNRHHATLLNAKDVREHVEPFLTHETFHLLFEAMYEFESTLQLAFGLVLNALVIGFEIDTGFPLAYALILLIVMSLQWLLRGRLANANLNNQKFTNRMTAQTYTAWDNIFSGNRHNFRLWHKTFKERLQQALGAQIHAILMREGLSSVSGIIGLVIIFATMAWVVGKDGSETALLVAMAATLPKQISLTHDVHAFAIGWNDLLALWTRVGGVVAHMRPERPHHFENRIGFDRLTLRQGGTEIRCSDLQDAVRIVRMQATGRIQVRGGNGSGKSSLLAGLKESLRGQAYYWPTSDRLAFGFVGGEAHSPEADELEDEAERQENIAPPPDSPLESRPPMANARLKSGFSSGERQIQALQEIVRSTSSRIYLLDEWDANLDDAHRARAQELIDRLALRARVIEISHRD